MKSPKYIHNELTTIAFLLLSLAGIVVAIVIYGITMAYLQPILPSFFSSQSVLHDEIMFASWMVLYILIWVAFVTYKIRMKRRVTSYQNALLQSASKHGWGIDQSSDWVKTFNQATLQSLDGEKRELNMFVQGNKWLYGQYAFDQVVRTNRGDYTTVRMRYAMMSFELSRKLPNIFFDSVVSRGRQFQKRFDKKQEHTLEGDFGSYFSTYFPPTYAIDGLSFVTPEVMEVLKNCADYDVEIIDNKLFLYGPLYVSQDPLADMVAKGKSLQAALEDNIDTYRDNRLPKGQDKEHVTPLGMVLKPRSVIQWSVYISIAYLLFQFVRIIVEDTIRLFNQ